MRNNRQAERPKFKIDFDRFKDVGTKFRESISRGSESLKDMATRGGEHFRKSTDAVKEKMSTFVGSTMDPLVSHASNFMKDSGKFMEGFKLNFGSGVRERRSADDERNNKRIPTLRVKEKETPCQTIENLKRLSESRVELRAPESIQYVPELAAQSCSQCGYELTDSVCKSCGAHQPQYVEYIEGEPVSFYPGAVQQQPREEPRYIYDRYGHRYLENNGNLRLVVPDYRQEAIVGSQPDFAGLADILNQNSEIMRQLNPFSGTDRMLPQPVDLADGAIDLIRDLARRDVEVEKPKTNENDDKKPSENLDDKKAEPERKTHAKRSQKEERKPKSIYQVLPMKHDGQNGKVVVKVYSDRTSNNDANGMNENQRVKAAERSVPTVRKFTKNTKEYEVLTFDHLSGANSDEEVQQILRRIHGKGNY